MSCLSSLPLLVVEEQECERLPDRDSGALSQADWTVPEPVAFRRNRPVGFGRNGPVALRRNQPVAFSRILHKCEDTVTVFALPPIVISPVGVTWKGVYPDCFPSNQCNWKLPSLMSSCIDHPLPLVVQMPKLFRPPGSIRIVLPVVAELPTTTASPASNSLLALIIGKFELTQL